MRGRGRAAVATGLAEVRPGLGPEGQSPWQWGAGAPHGRETPGGSEGSVIAALHLLGSVKHHPRR